MRDKLGVLIGQVYFPLSKGWAAFLTGVLYSSSHTSGLWNDIIS